MTGKNGNDLFSLEPQEKDNVSVSFREIEPEDIERELQLTIQKAEEQIEQLKDAQIVRQETMDEVVSV